MAINNALASLAVHDIAAATQWYTTLFGRPPDTQPMPTLAEWKFPSGGWLQVYALPERAGRGSVTLAITGFEEQVAALRQLGIDPGQPMGDERVRVVMIKDPDGNSIAFAESMDPKLAR